MDEQEIIDKNQTVFSGTLYMIKPKNYSPSEPSGKQGRYSGEGTKAYYFGDTPETCWREIKNHNPGAAFNDYQTWKKQMNHGTFVDVGAVEGTQYLQPNGGDGYEPTQALSDCLSQNNILGFRYASQPAFAQGTSGTCFCIYQSIKRLEQEEFNPVSWNPSNEV
jgi:RES domain